MAGDSQNTDCVHNLLLGLHRESDLGFQLVLTQAGMCLMPIGLLIFVRLRFPPRNTNTS